MVHYNNKNIKKSIPSAGPETQAVTHQDGEVKCAVQVISSSPSLTMEIWLFCISIQVSWEPAEGSLLSPTFSIVVARNFSHYWTDIQVAGGQTLASLTLVLRSRTGGSQADQDGKLLITHLNQYI